MIDATHPVSLIDSGTEYKFKLAESAEGEHYVEQEQPLRAPNAQVVQGAQGVFQMRQDTLVWRLDDWSGGEGQIKWDPKQPNRHRIIKADPFTEPGVLRPPYYYSDVTFTDTNGDDVKIDDFLPGVKNVRGQPFAVGYPYGGSHTTDVVVLSWSYLTEAWSEVDRKASAKSAEEDPTSLDAYRDVLDEFIIAWEGEIYEVSWNPGFGTGSIAGTALATGTSAEGDRLIRLGDYIYQYNHSGQVYEVAASSGSHTLFFDPAGSGSGGFSIDDMCRSSSRGYFVGHVEDFLDIEVYEIVPTTDAGTGSASLIATLPQAMAASCWYAAGLLFILTVTGTLYYLRRSGGDYGIVAVPPLDFPDVSSASRSGSDRAVVDDMLFFLGGSTTISGTEEGHVTALNLSSGATARVAFGSAEFGVIGAMSDSKGIHLWAGEYQGSAAFWANDRIDLTSSADDTRYAISPWHDFGITGDKLLTSIRVSCDVPAHQSVEIWVAVDGSDTFTLMGTINGSASGEQTITANIAIFFAQLSLKAVFYDDGSADETEIPRIYYIEARASVTGTQQVWQLLLDLADDNSSYNGQTGTEKRSDLKSLEGKALTFRNGYLSRKPNTYTDYDVIVDSVQIIASRPGESVAQVVLRELS